MPSSGPRKPRSEDGSELNATFEVSTVPVFEIVYHHKAGGTGRPRAVNTDYNEGLELLLTRLNALQMTILGISVDSTVARELEEADRELALDFPIRPHPTKDIHELRLDVSRAQKPIARRSNVKPGSDGNSQKRIRITVSADTQTLTYENLLRILTEGPRA